MSTTKCSHGLEEQQQEEEEEASGIPELALAPRPSPTLRILFPAEQMTKKQKDGCAIDFKTGRR